MQSTAFSPSLPFHKSPRRHKLPSSSFASGPLRLSSSGAASRTPGRSPPDAFSRTSCFAAPRRSWSLSSASFSSSSSSSSGPGHRPWSGVHDFGSDHESPDRFEAKAAAAAEVAGEGEQPSRLVKTLELGSLFGLWYLFNIYFNIYNKQVLKVFHYPINVTLGQFGVGSVFVLFMWTFNLYKRPKVSRAQLLAVLLLAVMHTLGNVFTSMSLGKVAVSFTHTVKATEPFFTVILSAMFLGEMPTAWVVGSLLPIVGGVGLASMTETSFNWAGFLSAMASNLANQSRNVLSKKAMVEKEDSMDNTTLFSIITVMSFFLLFPVAFFTEGLKFAPSHLQSVAQAGVNVEQLLTRSLCAALCFHAHQQVSYMILQRVSPVTHSVGNCVKRVVVIVSSVVFFQTPVSFINSLGTAIALAGVFLYSRVKRIKPKQKAA